MMMTDFIFKIDNKEYKCYASSISSISPFALDLIKKNQFWYNFESLKDPNEDFKQLIKLINGFEIDISISNVTLLNEVSKILNIQPLFKETESFIKSIKHTQNNNLGLLESYVSHQIPCPDTIVREIVTKWETYETLTDNPNEGLLRLSVESLETLFSSDNFNISNQETFFELIIKLVEQNGQKYSSLFSHCDFTKLTSNQMLKMIEIVSFDSIPTEIVNCLEQKFIQSTNSNYNSNSNISSVPESLETKFLNQKTKVCRYAPTYDDGVNYNGIFQFILRHSNDVFEKYVKLRSGGDKQRYLNTLFKIENFDLHWDNFSADSNPNLDFKNAWITITFPAHKVKLEDYTFITSPKNTINRPKSWTISARNKDQENWQIIEDRRLTKNSNDFADKSKYIKTFSIKSSNIKPYSQFKIQFYDSQGYKRGKEQEIVLHGLEFYGTLTRNI